MSEVKERTEDLWLSAESLERQLEASGASDKVMQMASDAVIATRELHSAVWGLSGDVISDIPVGSET